MSWVRVSTTPPETGSGAVDLTKSFPAAQQVGEELVRAGWTVATAESCTGGLVAAALAAAPDATRFFRGGVVAYASDLKAALLGVPEDVLATAGAVSAPTAQAMAAGVRRQLGADIGVGVTGLVGGSDEGKPPGLTYIAAVAPTGTVVVDVCGDQGPATNCVRAVCCALDLCLELARRAVIVPGSA